MAVTAPFDREIDGERDRVLTRCINIVESITGEPGEVGGRLRNYRRTVSWGEGSFVCWDTPGDHPHVHVALPGKRCHSLPWDRQMRLLRDLSIGARFSKLDIATDLVADRPLGVLELLDAWVASGLLRSHRTTRRYAETAVAKNGTARSNGGGRYFGSTKGQQGQTCVYDKGAELGESTDGRHVRVEFRPRKEKADANAHALIYLEDGSTSSKAAQLAIGSVRFADADGNVPEEWARVVQLVGGAEVVTVPRKDACIHRTMENFDRQWGRTFRELAYVSGMSVPEVFQRFLSDQTPKRPAWRKPLHTQWIEHIEREANQ